MPRLSQNRRAFVPGMVMSPPRPLARLSAPKQRLLPGPQLGHETLPHRVHSEVEAFEDDGAQQDRVAHDEGAQRIRAPEHLDGYWLRLVVDSLAERLAMLARVLDVSADYLLGLRDTAAPLGATPPVPECGVGAGG